MATQIGETGYWIQPALNLTAKADETLALWVIGWTIGGYWMADKYSYYCEYKGCKSFSSIVLGIITHSTNDINE